MAKTYTVVGGSYDGKKLGTPQQEKGIVILGTERYHIHTFLTGPVYLVHEDMSTAEAIIKLLKGYNPGADKYIEFLEDRLEQGIQISKEHMPSRLIDRIEAWGEGAQELLEKHKK